MTALRAVSLLWIVGGVICLVLLWPAVAQHPSFAGPQGSSSEAAIFCASSVVVATWSISGTRPGVIALALCSAVVLIYCLIVASLVGWGGPRLAPLLVAGIGLSLGTLALSVKHLAQVRASRRESTQ